MKHLLLLALLAFAPMQADNEEVYICMGPKSACYHKTPNCRGLRNCSTSIKKVTLKEAKEVHHRRACGICCR